MFPLGLWRGLSSGELFKSRNIFKKITTKSDGTCRQKISVLGQWMRFVLVVWKVKVLDWQGLCDGTMGLNCCWGVCQSQGQLLVNQLVSCADLWKDRGNMLTSSSAGCTSVLKMSSVWEMISVQECMLREQAQCYFEIQWHSLGQDKDVVVGKSSVPFHLYFFLPCTGKNKAQGQGCLLQSYILSRLSGKNLEFFKHESSSMYVVSQGTFCQRSEEEIERETQKNRLVIFIMRKCLSYYY